MSNETIDKKPGCGCGGHSCGSDAKEPAHSGCGCHAAPEEPTHSCGGNCRGVRTPRRVHAVLGLALTAFLFFHLGVAALAFVPARYDAAAHLLRALAGRVPIVEAVLLLLVATQAGVGIRLLARSGLRYDSGRCKDDGKLRYFLQRWSAVAILAFLALHLAMFKLRLVEESFAALSRRFTLGGSALLTGFYVFVLAGVAFHAGNGLWTGASVWGLRENHPFLWRGISISTGALVAILGFFALGFFVK